MDKKEKEIGLTFFKPEENMSRERQKIEYWENLEEILGKKGYFRAKRKQMKIQHYETKTKTKCH